MAMHSSSIHQITTAPFELVPSLACPFPASSAPPAVPPPSASDVASRGPASASATPRPRTAAHPSSCTSRVCRVPSASGGVHCGSNTSRHAAKNGVSSSRNEATIIEWCSAPPASAASAPQPRNVAAHWASVDARSCAAESLSSYAADGRR
eukprot:scaffold18436_cov122-Isochrysis_galbana.AAC.4